MKKKILGSFLILGLTVAITGCGGSRNVSYADGTYEAQSSVYVNEDEDEEDGNGYGKVTITIKDNKIVDCVFETFETDGTLKDENYGKADGEVANRDYYNKAQKAVAACAEYADMLAASGSLEDVDAISGATINYNEFVEAVNLALDQAETE